MWESSYTSPNGDVRRITAVSFGFTHRIWIGFLFSATCVFYFYHSALGLGTSFYYILFSPSDSPQVHSLSSLKCQIRTRVL